MSSFRPIGRLHLGNHFVEHASLVFLLFGLTCSYAWDERKYHSLHWLMMHLFGFMLAGYVQDKSEEDREGSDRPGEDKAAMMNHCLLK